MDLRLQDVAASHHGLISRDAAIGAGLTVRSIDSALRSGELVAVRRGVYADRAMWEALGPDESERLTGVAAGMAMRSDHVLSHDSAALLHGLPLVGRRDKLAHVTRDRPRGAETRWGVKHHVGSFREEDVVEVEGIRVLGIARTVLDLAREHGAMTGLVAADAALRRGLPRPELEAAAARMWSWPGKRHVDACLTFADARIESPGETLLYALVREAGIGPVELQFELRDAERWVRADLRVGRHVFEFDGKAKYEMRAGAARDPRASAWEEKLRQDWLHRHRLGVSRVVWDDFWGIRRQLKIRELRHDFAETCRRYGTSIDDLAPYVVRRAS